ncbi:MAG TPA: nitroreductase family deazaflavin-dependent oxidoreductase [Anaerolineae bacterium]|nr:nitroreductase family deazaflavin-dependent oxidoreductase [Anaerolineae bacterium]
MDLRTRLIHRLLRLLSDHLMLPLFEAMGGTQDSVLGGRLCVLRTIGRKSGQPREIPLNYAPTTAGVALLAGFGRSAGWVYNLRAQPRTEVLVGERCYRATAVEISHPVQALRATRAVLRNAGVAGFFYGWDPRRASDEQLAGVVSETVCFHLRFDEPPAWGA